MHSMVLKRQLVSVIGLWFGGFLGSLPDLGMRTLTASLMKERGERDSVFPFRVIQAKMGERGVGGGQDSSAGSVLGSLSSLMQHCGFNLPLKKMFLVEGIFPWS